MNHCDFKHSDHNSYVIYLIFQIWFEQPDDVYT